MATSVAILAQMKRRAQAKSDVLRRSKVLKRPAAVLKRPASAAICNASQWPLVAPRVEDAIMRGQQDTAAQATLGRLAILQCEESRAAEPFHSEGFVEGMVASRVLPRCEHVHPRGLAAPRIALVNPDTVAELYRGGLRWWGGWR